uniref:Uncharacterized protein n=1 Tax=Pithovirus LCDPAC02 TaxID=2506601 RepID=A0A481YPA3_9VIRU|nr:MAG: hypothetical protein LCDPAC02_00890 [Pithovirus LCDPAC02]
MHFFLIIYINKKMYYKLVEHNELNIIEVFIKDIIENEHDLYIDTEIQDEKVLNNILKKICDEEGEYSYFFYNSCPDDIINILEDQIKDDNNKDDNNKDDNNKDDNNKDNKFDFDEITKHIELNNIGSFITKIFQNNKIQNFTYELKDNIEDNIKDGNLNNIHNTLANIENKICEDEELMDEMKEITEEILIKKEN